MDSPNFEPSLDSQRTLQSSSRGACISGTIGIERWAGDRKPIGFLIFLSFGNFEFDSLEGSVVHLAIG